MIPHTTAERLALLEELERGEKIVIPVSYEHAAFMLKIATMYIEEQHQQTFNALKHDYS